MRKKPEYFQQTNNVGQIMHQKQKTIVIKTPQRLPPLDSIFLQK